MSSIAPQPLLAGFGATLLLGLAACSASNDEPAASVVAPPKMKQEVLHEAADGNASYAPQPSVAAGSMEARKAVPQLMPMIAPAAPLADSAAFGYQDVYREQYQKIESSPVQAVAQQPVSTFSIDVDTGAYANVRRFLNDGSLPPKDAVRLEELVNYFPYAYPKPEGDVPFSVATELATTPWNPETRLLRVAIKAADLSAAELPPANLVFLVDVSGSMDRREGLPMVQSTLKLLVDQLRPQDRVALVTYAGNASVVLESTAGSDKARDPHCHRPAQRGRFHRRRVGHPAGLPGSAEGPAQGRINRILLATDGDFNVGISDFETLKQLAADKRKTGVSLTTLGFGTDNYNEQLMEQLADAGDGNYAYIDNLREARKVLVDQLSSTLAVVAKDVKIQVEFNPAEVSEYRLLGYENRALKREDFSNDKVDAGEIGAGHTVTALYEVVPVGAKGWLEPLRYTQANEKPGKAGEIAWLRLRYKAPEGGASQLVERPIGKGQATPIAKASEDLRFAAAVAAFAQQLGDAKYTGDFSLADSARLARGAKGEDPFGLRGEFVQLVELAQSLQTPQNVQVRAD